MNGAMGPMNGGAYPGGPVVALDVVRVLEVGRDEAGVDPAGQADLAHGRVALVDVKGGVVPGQVAGGQGAAVDELAGDDLPVVAGQDGVILVDDVAGTGLAPLGAGRRGRAALRHDLGAVEAGVSGLEVDVVPVDGAHVLHVEEADVAGVGLAVLADGEEDGEGGEDAEAGGQADAHGGDTAVAAVVRLEADDGGDVAVGA